MEKLVLEISHGSEGSGFWTNYYAFYAESKEHLYLALVERLETICKYRSDNVRFDWNDTKFTYGDKTINVEYMIWSKDAPYHRTKIKPKWQYDDPKIYTLDELFDNLD
jgi:hypothetical protein